MAPRKVQPYAEQGHFTSVHNFNFDVLLPSLPDSAWKTLCVVIRQTRGWQRDEAPLGLRRLMTLTGIKSLQTMSKAVQVLVDRELIVANGRSSVTEETLYSLNRKFEADYAPPPPDAPLDQAARVTESVTRRATDSVTQPVTDSVTQPVTNSVTQPVTDSVTLIKERSLKTTKQRSEAAAGVADANASAQSTILPRIGEVVAADTFEQLLPRSQAVSLIQQYPGCIPFAEQLIAEASKPTWKNGPAAALVHLIKIEWTPPTGIKTPTTLAPSAAPTDPLKALWGEVIAELEQRDDVKSWLYGSRLEVLDDMGAVVATSNIFCRDHVAQHLIDTIAEALERRTGSRPPSIEVVIGGSHE